LVSTRACVLFGLIMLLYEEKLKNLPTIFQYITNITQALTLFIRLRAFFLLDESFLFFYAVAWYAAGQCVQA
jgi:hypothetical protein